MTVFDPIGPDPLQSRASAWRDLAELVERQAIEPIGEGRSRAYRLHWPGEPMPGDGP